MKPIDGIVLDFDGTLAPDVPEVAIAVLHETLLRWKPVPLTFVRQYFRTVSAFRMDRSLALFLDSLGLSDRIGEVAQALGSTAGWGPWTVGLDPDTRTFLQSRPRGRVKVFSSGGAKALRFAPLLEILHPEDFLSYPECAKSDPATWQKIADDQGWNPCRRVVVDDSPLALWAAKTGGYLTVLRTNSVFTERDHHEFRPWIDHKVRSLAELGRRFKPF